MNVIVSKYVRKTNKRKNIKISREDCDIVGIHIRRTDHVMYEEMNGAPPLTARYFKLAMEAYLSKLKHPIFVVVTDDPEWAESQLQSFFNIHFTGRYLAEIS